MIYKLDTFKAFTDKENKLYKKNKRNRAELLEEIKSNENKKRSVDKGTLYNEDGSSKEWFQIPIFEGDIVRLALDDRGETKANYQLLDEILYMEVFHNDILWQIIKNDVDIAGKDYIFYSATTGQVRNKTVVLMRKDFYKKHKETLLVGLSVDGINEHGGMNVGKFLAYTSLPLSASVLPEKEIDIDRCILVNGLETDVTGDVKYIDIKKDEDGQCYVDGVKKDYIKKTIKIEHTDGAGMFLPGELPSSCQIRSGFFKGAMFPFDFRLFAKEIARNTIIHDAWGDQVDVEKEDIRYIFTTSQLKTWKQYSSWKNYKKAFKDNHIKLSINSYANPPKDTVSCAYQYLQTLPYGCDVSRLCEKAKEDIMRLHRDFDYVIDALGYTDDCESDLDSSKTVYNEINDNGVVVTDNSQLGCDKKKSDSIVLQDMTSNALLAKAIKIYPQLIYDPYIKDKIKKMVTARRRSYLAGKIPLDGYYSYAVPDMYAFCEFLFEGDNNPEGLIPANCVYNKYYAEKGNVERVVCLRSPHLSNYEYAKRDLVKTEACKKWFRNCESDTIVSCHDLISKTLQMDWDGDEILISNDPELYRLAESLPDVPLYYEMQQAEPQQINQKAIYDTLVKGFANNVIGDSSNAITKLWNTPKATNDNPIPYDDEINVFCAFSNYAIDYPKTGKALNIGKYDALYRKLIMQKSEVKHPNFFIEAKGKKSNNVEKLTNSVMDRIKSHIAKDTGRIHYKFFGDADNKFDYRMLMNWEVSDGNVYKYNVDRSDDKYEKLFLSLLNRKIEKQIICRKIGETKIKRSMDLTEIRGRFDKIHYYCVREIKSIFTNKKGFFDKNLAVNYYIDIEYSQKDFTSSSKDILWKCFGHILLENLQRNINNAVDFKTKPKMAYTKAMKGDEDLDKELARILERQCLCIAINQSDMNFIESSLKTFKNGKPYNNDMELLYVLYCLYKGLKEAGKLWNDYLIIKKKKHTVRYNTKSKKKKTEINILNMNRIAKMANVQSYAGSFQRFKDVSGIEIINNREKDRYEVKFDVPSISDNDNHLFDVKNIYDPLVYLQAYKQNKTIYKCKICGRDFIKSTNNQKTCSDKCKKKLRDFNQMRTNERNREIKATIKKAI